MIPIPTIPEGHGRLILGFSNKTALDQCIKAFDLKADDADIEAFVLRMNIGTDCYYLLRAERKMAPHDVLGDLLYTMVPGIWRQNARFIYRENADGDLIQVKHSCDCDPEETVKVLNALVTLNMPIFKGRMGLRTHVHDRATAS
jgi:hypothetical protein